jgi:hypothetical protein
MRSVFLTPLLLLACTAAPSVDPGQSERASGFETLGASLDAFGLPADAILRDAAYLGTEVGWDVFRVPAYPAPGEPFRIAIVADSDFLLPDGGAFLRGSTNGFQDFVDVPGTLFTSPDGLPYYVWGPVTLPVSADFAIRVENDGGEYWLNNQGNDFSVPVAPHEPLTFAGRVTTEQGDVPHDVSADGLWEGNDLVLHVDTFPQTGGVQGRVLWSVDGQAQPPVDLELDGVDAGPFDNDTRWEATLPVGSLPLGAVVDYRIEVRSSGAPLIADDNGTPFSATVGAAPSLDWWQVGVFGFNQCHWDGFQCQTGWDWVQPLPNPLGALPTNYQAYAFAPSPSVEIYIPGLTDRTDLEFFGLDLLKVEVVSPFFGGDPAAPEAGWPMRFRERVGNNLRYDWLPRAFQAPLMPALGVACPADGLYDYAFRVSTNGGRTWQRIGDGTAPETGADFQIDWANLQYAPGLSFVPPTFAGASVGSDETVTFEIINTTGTPLVLSDFAVDVAAFSFGWAGCPDGDCEIALDPAERHTVTVHFAPDAVGEVEATLSWHTENPEDCNQQGSTELALVAEGL